MQYLVNMLLPRRSCSAATCWRVSSTSRSVCLATLAVFSLGRRAFGRAVGTWAAILFFTMPFTATLMIRAWVEFALALYVLCAMIAVLAWRESGARGWLALAAVMGRLRRGHEAHGGAGPRASAS